MYFNGKNYSNPKEEWVAFLLLKLHSIRRHINMQNEKKLFTTQNMMRMALLSVIAVLLMQFGALKLPMIFPSFLELDFSEVPAIIGVLTIHPLAGFVIVILKNILKVVLFQTNTAYAGELANMVVSLGYILPLSLMVMKKRDFKTITIGICVGIIGLTLAGAIVNYFITIPMYAKLFMPMDAIIGMGNAIYSGIVDKGTLILYSFIPFNLLKGSVVSVVSIIIVKGLQPVIKHFGYHIRG